jgi:hypothetical protein
MCSAVIHVEYAHAPIKTLIRVTWNGRKELKETQKADGLESDHTIERWGLSGFFVLRCFVFFAAIPFTGLSASTRTVSQSQSPSPG